MGRVIDPNTQYAFDGQPVVGGKAYYGVANQDPKLNPITVYSDAGFTVPITNPQDTDAQGRVINRVFVNVQEYSYTVDDALGNQLLTEPALNPLAVSGLVTGDIDMNGFHHTDVGDATANDQYNTFGQSTKLYRQVLAATGVSANVIEASFPIPPDSLVDGQQVVVETITANSTGAFTLKLNAFAPKACLRPNGSTPISSDLPGAGYYAEFIFDSVLDSFILQNPYRINAGQYGPKSIANTDIADKTITQLNIGLDQVGRGEMEDMPQFTIIGKNTAGTGDPLYLTMPDFFGMVPDDSVTNPMLDNMPALTIKGNDTGGAADPKDLTLAELSTMLLVGGYNAYLNAPIAFPLGGTPFREVTALQSGLTAKYQRFTFGFELTNNGAFATICSIGVTTVGGLANPLGIEKAFGSGYGGTAGFGTALTAVAGASVAVGSLNFGVGSTNSLTVSGIAQVEDGQVLVPMLTYGGIDGGYTISAGSWAFYEVVNSLNAV